MEQEYKWLEEKKVDVQDLFSWLILKWKPILSVALIGLVLGALFCIITHMNKPAKQADSPEKKLEDAKSALSDTEAMEVENALNDYQIFQNYNKELGRFSSVFLNTENNDGVIMIAKYYVVSRLKYCNSLYTDLAISSEDYKKIYGIAYPDVTEGEDPAASNTCPLQFLSERGGDSDVYMTDEKDALSSADTILITAYIKAASEEQCNAILDVINASFEKETQRLKKTDDKTTCRCVDTGFISDQNNFYDNAEKMVVERLDAVNKAITSLKNNQIEKFSKDQKKYYDALKSFNQNKDSQEAADTSDKKQKKGISIAPKDFIEDAGVGFLAGLVLAADILILFYLTSGKVKSYKELGKFDIQTLDTIYYETKDNVIHRLARFVKVITPTNIEKQLAVLSQDISIMLKSDGANKLYLFWTINDKKSDEVANTVKDFIEKNGFKVAIGNPLVKLQDLQELSDSDKVVMLASMKKTRKSTIIKAGAICQRCSKEIYGFIAIDEC